MSSPLREILARFSVKMDGVERVKAADDNVDGLIGRLGKLGQALAGSAIVYGLYRVGSSALTAASELQEAQNLVEIAFGDDAGGVQKWAAEAGAAMGLSTSAMVKMAGEMGGLLTPMMEGNTEASAEMSKRLSELAVDLSSTYSNIVPTAAEAMSKLRSGLTGEMEPMKALGVIMTEANLATFAHAKGLGTWGKAMDGPTKTAIRFLYILENTTIAQGDAIRTGKGYANASKAVLNAITSLAETVGKKLLPAAEAALAVLRRWIPDLTALVEKSYLLESVLLLGAAAAAKFALSMAAANLPILAGALGIGVMVLAMEELIALFDNEGGLARLGEMFAPLEKRVAWIEKTINAVKLSWLALQGLLSGGDSTAFDAERARQISAGEARPGEDIDVTLQRRAAVQTQRGIDNRNLAVAQGDLGSFLSAPGSNRLTREDRFEQFKERRAEFLQSNPEAATDKDLATFGPSLQYVPPAAGGASNTTTNAPTVNIHLAPGTNRDTVNEVQRVVEAVIDRKFRQGHAASAEQAPDA